MRDDTFALGTGAMPGNEPSAYVSDIAVQADGKILVGGFFGAFDVETQYRNVVRLLPNASVGVREHVAQEPLRLHLDNAGYLYIMQSLPIAGTSSLRMYNTSGQVVLEHVLTGAGQLPVLIGPMLATGMYLVQVQHDQGTAVGRVVVE